MPPRQSKQVAPEQVDPYASLPPETYGLLRRLDTQANAANDAFKKESDKATELARRAAAALEKQKELQRVIDTQQSWVATMDGYLSQGFVVADEMVTVLQERRRTLPVFEAQANELAAAAKKDFEEARVAKEGAIALEAAAVEAVNAQKVALLKAKQLALDKAKAVSASLTAAAQELDDELRAYGGGFDSDAAFNGHSGPLGRNSDIEVDQERQDASNGSRDADTAAGQDKDAIGGTEVAAAGGSGERQADPIDGPSPAGTSAGSRDVQIISTRKDANLPKRRGRITESAAKAIKAMRKTLWADINKMALEHGVHPADVRQLLGFNEEQSRDANMANRYRSWRAKSDAGRASGDNPNTLATFNSLITKEWNDIKDDEEKRAAVEEKIEAWESKKSAANQSSNLNKGLKTLDNKLSKIIGNYEFSRGICSVVIIGHPHYEVAGHVVGSTYSQNLLNQAVKVARNLDHLAISFSSRVSDAVPKSMNPGPSHKGTRNATATDDGSDGDEDVENEEREGEEVNDTEGQQGDDDPNEQGRSERTNTTSRPAAGASSSAAAGTSSSNAEASVSTSVGTAARKKKKPASLGEEASTKASMQLAKDEISKALLKVIEDAMRKHKVTPNREWLTAKSVANGNKAQIGSTGKRPSLLSTRRNEEVKAPLKHLFTLVGNMGLAVEGWPKEAKQLLDGPTAEEGETWKVWAGSLHQKRKWHVGSTYALKEALVKGEVKVVKVDPRLRPRTGDEFDDGSDEEAMGQAPSRRRVRLSDDEADGPDAGEGQGTSRQAGPRKRAKIVVSDDDDDEDEDADEDEDEDDGEDDG